MTFHQLTTQAIREIRPLLQSQLPFSTMILNIVDLTLNCKYPPGHHIDFYSLNGVPKDPKDLFLDIFIRPKHQPMPCSVIHAPKVPTEAMLKAFVDHHDWSKPNIFESVAQPIAAEMVKVIVETGGGMILYPTSVLYMPVEDALRIELKDKNPQLTEQFEIDNLSPEHADKINYYWKYGFEGGEHMLRESLKTMGGVGLFKKPNRNHPIGPRSPENMVGWLTLQHLGTLGALYTMDEYRGKGLAKYVMEAGSKWVAKQKLIPVVEVEHYNVTSLRVMEAIGYKFIHDIFWIDYTPATVK